MNDEELKKYNEIEEKKILIGKRLQNPNFLRENEESSLDLVNRFLLLCEEQQKIEPYKLKKKAQIKIITTIKNYLEAMIDLKTKNRARYERFKNSFRQKIKKEVEAVKK